MGIRRHHHISGLSLVELVIAVALLGLISVAALQFVQMTEISMFGEQSRLTKQQRSDAISAHIYKKFASGTLAEPMSDQVYVDADMPQDLRDGPGMTLVALFGNSSRFNGVDPRCALTSDADLAAGTFRIRHDCMVRGGQSIVQQMNALIGNGVVLTTGLEDGVGRCSISKPIPVDTSTGMATVTVDDPGCLAYGQDLARGVPAGNQVLLPRFVAYDTASPASFHTSMIEPPDIATAGVGLEMPDQYTVVGHGGLNVVSFVDALANDPQADVYLELQTDVAMSRLSLPSVPATVRTAGAGSAKLSLEGPLADVRNALQQLEYRSPSGYMGEDRLTGKIRSGSLIRSDNTTLKVAVKCGGQTCGTGTRFDLGEFNPNTGDFTVRQYITSVSVCGSELPSTYYGYCGTKFKYDRADGLVTRYPDGDPNYHKTQCALAGGLTYGDPNNTKKRGFPYVLYSPKARDFQAPDHVTVFLYEQTSTPLNAAQEAQLMSLTENRFSLFFQFDTFDSTGGTVNFQLNNIAQGRNLRARGDPFTVIDDPEDFNPGTIGSDGTLNTTASWRLPNDGIVIPLRLSAAAFNPATGLYELRRYSHDPDRDGVVHQKAGRTIAEPVLNFGCATMVPSQLKDLRDGTWHHVAVTFGGTGSNGLANTAKLYVDGVAVPMAFVACPGSPGIGVSTGKSPLYIGRDIADRQSGLKGLVSDLQIWDRQLGAPEIKELAGREPGAGQNIAGLQISLPLDSYSAGSMVNRGAWPIGRTAALFNAEGRSPIVQTLVDATNFHSFCFLDIDNDGLYELWESKTSKTLPPLPLGTVAQLNAKGWQSRSDDLFVPGQSGFFKVVGRDPESVIANFAIGKGVLRQENRQQKTESKALASTRVKKRPALCAITSEPKLATPACRLDAAFIAIDGYIPGLHGELDMEHVRWRVVGGTKTASELPNMPTDATATWYPELGVMKFTSPLPLETRIWNRVISQTLYRPSGRSSDATITFRYGVGGLPFFDGSTYHMHDFVETSLPLAFDNATTSAQSAAGAFCNMRSYLAAVTSEAEQDHLEVVMKTSNANGWQSGWIGGVIRQGQTFEWVSLPQTAAIPFWQGDGAAGLPYNAVTGQRAAANAATFFEFDQKPGQAGHRKRVLAREEGTAPIRYRYTNWAAGTDDDSCDSRSGISKTQRAQYCEPMTLADGAAVAIHGHLNRDGTWVSMPGSTVACDATTNHSVCGYYREFDSVGLPAGTVLGAKLTVNMDRFREFCEGS